MLAKANRVTSALDFRQIVRSGTRARGAVTLAYGRRADPDAPLRLGVIVARNVGGAVVRNRVRRRIKAVAWGLTADYPGLDVVVRALPAAASSPFDDIRTDVTGALERLSAKAAAR